MMHTRWMARARAALCLAAVAGAALVLTAPGARADEEHAAAAGHDDHGHGDEHGADHGDNHGAHDGHGAHGSGKVNLYYGILGEGDAGEEPSLLFRSPGMPVPLLAQAINTFLLFYLLFRFGKKPIVEGLRERRRKIMEGMDSAAKMKAEAQASLNQYELKLQKVDQEIERVRREMREAAEAEREAILEEAKKRRERMERDAKVLITQELKAAREILLQETIKNAVQSAERIVSEKGSAADHQRLSDEYLSGLRGSIQKSGLSNAGGPQ